MGSLIEISHAAPFNAARVRIFAAILGLGFHIVKSLRAKAVFARQASLGVQLVP
ncbi:hypothetical protein [Lichenihabitans psoromatis]|uniref:hypothetical protein n=1 Tax=Lichenihabitans psoromatis TaxID=2528642 RepID=UPI0013F16E49|nr:hypothetical protein [Lichenihabitans psoromatis]